MNQSTSQPGPSTQLTSQLAEASKNYANNFAQGQRSAIPSLSLAVVTCMDVRVDPYSIFGLLPGQAHILRTAGAVVTEDVVRSLCLSQLKLNSRSVVVMGHTQCGLEGLSDDAFYQTLSEHTAESPAWKPQGFDDVEASVTQSVELLKSSPFLAESADITGCIFDVSTGKVTWL